MQKYEGGSDRGRHNVAGSLPYNGSVPNATNPNINPQLSNYNISAHDTSVTFKLRKMSPLASVKVTLPKEDIAAKLPGRAAASRFCCSCSNGLISNRVSSYAVPVVDPLVPGHHPNLNEVANHYHHRSEIRAPMIDSLPHASDEQIPSPF